jgi:hypothetical protein
MCILRTLSAQKVQHTIFVQRISNSYDVSVEATSEHKFNEHVSHSEGFKFACTVLICLLRRLFNPNFEEHV